MTTYRLPSLNIVALGGGHGLSAALRALKQITPSLTAIVGVSDNGGSSGRLREEFSVIPPGDLRMALTALCDEETEGRMWAEVLQHRFPGSGPLQGHALGNLLIAALWQKQGDVVAGLDAMCRLLHAHGRVLPLSLQPLDVVADVEFIDGAVESVFGQVSVARTQGKVIDVRLEPENALMCPETMAAIASADVIVMGPGSWYTSVINHVVLPEMAAALRKSTARKLLIANLCAQTGETSGYSLAEHLESLAQHGRGLAFEAVFIEQALAEKDAETAAQRLGAKVVSAHIADSSNPQVHDPSALAQVLASYLEQEVSE
ncbi:MAG: hypothetical protein RIS43_121 [Actinomycetota bacterium]